MFNLRTRTGLRLRERPLVVMDASLLEYQQVPLDAVPEAVERLARTVRRFDGEMTLLWHNDRLLSRRALDRLPPVRSRRRATYGHRRAREPGTRGDTCARGDVRQARPSQASTPGGSYAELPPAG